MHLKQNVHAPYALSFQHSLHSTDKKDDEARRNSPSMNFVRGILDEDVRDFRGISQFQRRTVEQDADFVHIKMMRNNTFVTMTDSKGKKKLVLWFLRFWHISSILFFSYLFGCFCVLT